jgi:hypothetical protein
MAGTATPEIEPMAFINGASHFAWAAEELQKFITPGSNDPHTGPVYLLMAHAIELALKGYLRLHGYPTAVLAKRPYKHDLQKLYSECSTRGMRFPAEKACGVGVIVGMFDRSNEAQGLRYFTLKSQQFPELSWGIEIVREIVTFARQAAIAKYPDAEKPGPAAKANMIFGKPWTRNKTS